MGPVEALDEQRCTVLAGAESLELLTVWLGMLDADFQVPDSPELAARLRLVALRYNRAAAATNVRDCPDLS